MQQRVIIDDALYALQSWTVREHNGKYQIAPTSLSDDSRKWSKSYETLTRATNAIARKLQEEWTTRHQRRVAFHSKKRRK